MIKIHPVIVFAAIVTTFALGVLLLHGLNLGSILVTAALIAVAVVIFMNRVRCRIWLAAKFNEWRNDVRQLGLWLSLAFRRNRDRSATAAMAHQQAFLTGRLMSPMNLFAVAALIIVGGLAGLGIEEWRIYRLKRERDAPCSARELSLNGDGRFRTSRMSCSALGATLGVAVQWQERASELEALNTANIETVRAEGEAQLNTERARRRRAERLAARQRRRENEAIVSAYGGLPPDLERSVCELAGGVDCGPAGSVGGATATPAADLPVGTGDAGDAADPGIAAADPAAER